MGHFPVERHYVTAAVLVEFGHARFEVVSEVLLYGTRERAEVPVPCLKLTKQFGCKRRGSPVDAITKVRINTTET
jgi:hypothetical protein